MTALELYCNMELNNLILLATELQQNKFLTVNTQLKKWLCIHYYFSVVENKSPRI